MFTTSSTTPSSAPEGEGKTRAERTETLVRRLRAAREEGRDADGERIVAEIVEVNMGLATTLARRYYGHGEQSGDLDQTAYLGLVQAVRRFDPSRGTDLLAFAVPTILGELRRHFRDQCWTVRPPRRVQELQGRIGPVTEDFAQRHGRNPVPREVAAQLDVSEGDVIEALAAGGCFAPASLDRPLDREAESATATSLGDVIGVQEDSYERVETHQVLTPLVRRLPRRDRKVLELRFFWDWTQEQIAGEIGVTQMQVSRIISRIVRQLRGEVDDLQVA